MSCKIKWAGYICVLSTAPDVSEAERIAEVLVSEKLVACVNIIPGLKSVYWWNGDIQHDQEAMMVMKTRRKHFNSLEKRIKALHTYEVPEVLALSVYRGSEEYLNWICNSVKP